MLIVSTKADLSLPLFYQESSAHLIAPHHILFGNSGDALAQIMQTDFQYLYFRDPFNENKIPSKTAQFNTTMLLTRYAAAYKVDGIKKFAELFSEDKWQQYQLFSTIMPSTQILDSIRPPAAEEFIKKRLSARSKGVIFGLADYPEESNPHDYIIQQQLDIEEEYRVYMIADKVIAPLAVKSSKKPGQRARLTGIKDQILQPILGICQEVYAKTKYDLCGLDIAKSKGDYYLIEVNRSPQFNKYLELSGHNLATLLAQNLLR
jgi:glutathione synthase/RimK-type ligase-like ATP-grasp enzyme